MRQPPGQRNRLKVRLWVSRPVLILGWTNSLMVSELITEEKVPLTKGAFVSHLQKFGPLSFLMYSDKLQNCTDLALVGRKRTPRDLRISWIDDPWCPFPGSSKLEPNLSFLNWAIPRECC